MGPSLKFVKDKLPCISSLSRNHKKTERKDTAIIFPEQKEDLGKMKIEIHPPGIIFLTVIASLESFFLSLSKRRKNLSKTNQKMTKRKHSRIHFHRPTKKDTAGICSR